MRKENFRTSYESKDAGSGGSWASPCWQSNFSDEAQSGRLDPFLCFQSPLNERRCMQLAKQTVLANGWIWLLAHSTGIPVNKTGGDWGTVTVAVDLAGVGSHACVCVCVCVLWGLNYSVRSMILTQNDVYKTVYSQGFPILQHMHCFSGTSVFSTFIFPFFCKQKK